MHNYVFISNANCDFSYVFYKSDYITYCIKITDNIEMVWLVQRILCQFVGMNGLEIKELHIIQAEKRSKELGIILRSWKATAENPQETSLKLVPLKFLKEGPDTVDQFIKGLKEGYVGIKNIH